MKVKYIDLLRCVTPMKKLCEKEDIRFKTALAISKNVSAIDSAIEKYLEMKSSLNEKYLITENDTQIIKNGSEESYLKELTELNSAETDVQVEKLDPDDLAGITFPPKYIESIMFMLDIKKE